MVLVVSGAIRFIFVFLPLFCLVQEVKILAQCISVLENEKIYCSVNNAAKTDQAIFILY